MPERISDELLAILPVTQDEYERALKELVRERVMLNRRTDADARQDAALARLAEAEARAGQRLEEAIAKFDAIEIDPTPITEEPPPAAKPKAKKEKK